MIVNFYDKNKLVGSYYANSLKEVKANPKAYHAGYTEDMNITEVKYTNPIFDNGILREMTRDEMVASGIEVVLSDGEKIEKEQIIKVECPQDLVSPKWSKELFVWVEGADREILMIQRKNKILEYKKIKTEIADLKEFEEEFESTETVALLEEKLEELKKEINNLLIKIKKLGD